MALKFSEMAALRTDLALNLEAGFKNYLEEIGDGYGDFLAPGLEEGESPFDARQQLILMQRAVARQRQRLEDHDDGVVDQNYDDDKVSAEINVAGVGVVQKLRAVRHTCRGVYGDEGVKRVGLVGRFPDASRLIYRRGKLVYKSLLNPGELGLKPRLKAFDNKEEGSKFNLADDLNPELTELGWLIDLRHEARRKAADVRLRRQRVIQDFDYNIRAIVRLAQGMFRLARRDDLARRFRAVLQRISSKRQTEEATEAQPETATAPAADETATSESVETAVSETSKETVSETSTT